MNKLRSTLYLFSLPFRYMGISICLIAAIPVLITVMLLTGENLAPELEEILREQWFK